MSVFPFAGQGGRRARGGFAIGRVLGAARVVLATGADASGVGAAVAGALVAPFLADEEGQGLGVFGDVGALAVGAHAAVGQVDGVARVAFGLGAGGRGVEADQRAFGDLLGAPVFCVEDGVSMRRGFLGG